MLDVYVLEYSGVLRGTECSSGALVGTLCEASLTNRALALPLQGPGIFGYCWLMEGSSRPRIPSTV
jgi:hypothetical protein